MTKPTPFDFEEPELPIEPDEPEEEEDDDEDEPLAQIVVQFDTSTVWQPHDVYGRLQAFNGQGIMYLEGDPNL